MLRSVGLAGRALIVVLCALGLVSMHQLAAAALPAHTSHAAHHCDPAATTSAAPGSCSDMMHVCAAVPVESDGLPAPTESVVGLQPPAEAGCHLATPAVGSGTDPPELTHLSVSRT